MNSFRDAVSGKKVTLLGLGLLGRGVGDALFLAQNGAAVTVTDRKTEAELAESVAKLEGVPGVTLHLGGHDMQDFTSADLVIKAAGVRIDSPEIAAARAAGVPVAMSTALFAKYAREAGAIIVGVTGTRGKSTVTHMIHHALRAAGRRAHLGGNVRGISTLAMLPEVGSGDVVVLELDSWQLQGFGDLRLSPDVAVFTNLMPDHQNYYRSMDEYFADKANIFRFQQHGDTLVVGALVAERVRTAHPPVEPLVPGDLAPDWGLRIPGQHNRSNAALAASALLALGLTSEAIRSGLESFDGVEGRLQLVAERAGVQIYNDNNATTPEATMAALAALDTGKRSIVLICGGSDKGLELGALADAIRATVARVVLLVHPNYAGSERLRPLLEGVEVVDAGSMSDAVAAAVDSSLAGPIVFSPAFASFGMFKNEYDRNDQFMHLVTSL